jgi:hypothetical protein
LHASRSLTRQASHSHSRCAMHAIPFIMRDMLTVSSVVAARAAHCQRLGVALLFSLLLPIAPVPAAENVQQQMRQIEAALTRISQEQQSVYQQFNMVQELRRNDERQLLPLPMYGVTPGTPPNYDDVKRMEETRAQRVRDLQYELDRLYGRYRELEEQKRPLLEALSVLAQQRPVESPAEKPAATGAAQPAAAR